MKMDECMKEIGSMGSEMALELRLLKMEMCFMEHLCWVNQRVKEFTSGKMDVLIKEAFKEAEKRV